MEYEEKVRILKYLDTKDLIAKIHQYEDALEKELRDEMSFKAQNHQYLGSGDCQEVKRILGELSAQAPENDAGKKMTIADKETWLIRQRTENKELNEAITKQRQVSFLVDDHQLRVDMTRRRLAGAIAVLALRTQQLAFLAED